MKRFIGRILTIIFFSATFLGCTKNSTNTPAPDHKTWGTIPDASSTSSKTNISNKSEDKTFTPGKRCSGDAALILLVDKSGSTRDSRTIDLFKLGLTQLIKALPSKIEVSLVAFDSTSFRLTPLKKLTPDHREMVTKRIGFIFGAGITKPTEGLAEAERLLSQTKLKCREVLVITDARINNDEYTKTLVTVANMHDAGIVTSSAVLLDNKGGVADFEKVSEAGKGFFVSSTDPTRFFKLVSEQLMHRVK